MPKPRYLAPWQQPDVMAILEAEGLSVEELAALKGKPAIYHCISRVVDRRFVLGEAEKEQFVAYMRLYERFCEVRVLAFCVMSNHFHILLEVPMAPEERGADWSDERLLEHLGGSLLRGADGERCAGELDHYRGAGEHGGRGGVPGALLPADVGSLGVHEDRSSSASRAGSTGSTGARGRCGRSASSRCWWRTATRRGPWRPTSISIRCGPGWWRTRRTTAGVRMGRRWRARSAPARACSA